MLEDMNIIEEAIDRLLAHIDLTEAMRALVALKAHLDIADEWCQEHSTTVDFSY